MKALTSLAAFFLLMPFAFAQVSEATRQADYLINNYQFEKALLALEAVEDSSISVLQRKAYCYSRLGHVDKARAFYLKVVQQDSLNRSALQQLGLLFVKNEEFDAARDCFGKLTELDSTNSYYFKQLANVLAETEDVLGAVVNYVSALELNPMDVEAYTGVSEVLIAMEQFPTADSILTVGLEKTGNKRIELMLARVKLDEEQYDLVIRHVNHVLEKNDTTTVEARLLGLSYHETHDYHKAIQCMRFLETRGVKSDWMYYYMGSSYHHLGDHKNSIPALTAAIDQGISDNIGVYHMQLAMAYEQAHDHKNAIKYYQAAYEYSKSDILLYHLARNYDEYYEDKTNAVRYFKKYLKTDDTVKVARQYAKYRLHQLSSELN